MSAGPLPAASAQRPPVPGRFPDYLGGYSPLAKEVRLKNDGE
jgi:hypothetical protein